MSRFVTVLAYMGLVGLAVGPLSGCDLFAPTALPGDTTPPDSFASGEPVTPGVNIDGRWRHEASGQFDAACILIENNRVTQYDVDCDGTDLSLASMPQIQAFSGNIQVFFAFSDPPGDPLNGGIYTYTLRKQENGTLVGTGILRTQPAGDVKEANVVWVQQKPRAGRRPAAALALFSSTFAKPLSWRPPSPTSHPPRWRRRGRSAPSCRWRRPTRRAG